MSEAERAACTGFPATSSLARATRRARAAPGRGCWSCKVAEWPLDPLQISNLDTTSRSRRSATSECESEPLRARSMTDPRPKASSSAGRFADRSANCRTGVRFVAPRKRMTEGAQSP